MANKEQPLISIVIVNHNGLTYGTLEPNLKSIFNSNYARFEVIFVDNASTDGSVEFIKKLYEHSKVKIICNPKNYGFSRGNNVGIKRTKGEYIAFLNNDTVVDPNWLKELVNVMKTDSSIGAAQAKLLSMDQPNHLWSAGHYIDLLGLVHVVGVDEEDKGQYDRVTDIFAATAAAFIVKKKVLEEIGAFDSDYFMSFDETDLCWRIWLSGYRIVFVPKAVVYHKGGITAHRVTSYAERAYFNCRNRTMTLLKNCELTNLLKYVPVHLILLLGYCLMKVKKHDIMTARSVMRAIIWNFLNLKVILGKRNGIQRARKVSDDFLINKQLIKKPNIKRVLELVSY